ncbi:hypothetical protein AB1Y20_016947 [Prymnesium parvum]|uniref:WW domain-containing protein n=1 Tax=Prymnesium parvum TaxID=97485 RepID=A0AB34I9J3_PRYPA
MPLLLPLLLLSAAPPTPLGSLASRLVRLPTLHDTLSFFRSHAHAASPRLFASLPRRRMQSDEWDFPPDAATQLAQFRRDNCTDALKRSLDAQAAALSSSFELPPLSRVVDGAWRCVCRDFSLSPPEYAELFAALASDAASDVKAPRVVAAVEALLPVLMGEGGLCASGCQDFIHALGDWLIGSFTWESLAQYSALVGAPALDVPPSFPPLSALGGLPGAAVKCICSSFDWTKLASLFSDDIAEVVAAGLDADDDDAWGTVATPAVEAAIESTSKYPSFLLGAQGLCSTGCEEASRIVSRFTIRAVGASVEPASVGAAIEQMSADNLYACACGGTLEWQKMMGGLASAVDAAAESNDTSTSEDDVAYLALGNVFSPSFLCSSAACKATSADVMRIVSAVGAAEADATLTEIGEYEWCPATDKAGYNLEQTYTLDETLASFTVAKQDLFKSKLLSSLNAAMTGRVKLTAGAITLSVSAGSVLVDVSVTMAQAAVYADVESRMTELASTSVANLSALLGVTVAAAPSAVVSTDVATKQSAPPSEGSSTGLVVGIAAGAAVGVLALSLLAWQLSRRKSEALTSRGVSTKSHFMPSGTDIMKSRGEATLPPNWQKVHDPATGHDYFYNSATGQSTWTAPEDVQMDDLKKGSRMSGHV